MLVAHQLIPVFLVQYALERAQVEARIAGHGDHAAGVHLNGNRRAFLGQLDLAFILFILCQNLCVRTLPVICLHHLQLFLVNGRDGLGKCLFGHRLHTGIQRENDTVAVYRRLIRQLADGLAVSVDLHHARALPIGHILRELVLQRGLDAALTDQGVARVASLLICLKAAGRGDLGHIADVVRRQ